MLHRIVVRLSKKHDTMADHLVGEGARAGFDLTTRGRECRSAERSTPEQRERRHQRQRIEWTSEATSDPRPSDARWRPHVRMSVVFTLARHRVDDYIDK